MTCLTDDQLAARVDGELTENQNRTADAHLSTCGHCRAMLDRMRRAVQALPAAVPSRDDAAFSREVIDGLTRAGRSPLRSAWSRPLGLAVAALLAVVLVPRLRSPSRDEEVFTARGGPNRLDLAREAGLAVFVHPGSAPGSKHPPAPREVVRAGDGFSFELFNRTKEALYTAVLAVDASGEVHWFYPAWRDSSEDPSSVEVPPGSPAHALSDGVTPEGLAPGELQVLAVFTRTPLRVSQIERALREGPLATVGDRLDGAAVQRVVLTATR